VNDEGVNMIVKKTNMGHEEGIVDTVLVEEGEDKTGACM